MDHLYLFMFKIHPFDSTLVAALAQFVLKISKIAQIWKLSQMVMKETPRKRLRVPPKSATFSWGFWGFKFWRSYFAFRNISIFLRKEKLNPAKENTFSCREIIPYQGLNWVDQLLSLDISSCGDRPDRKGDQTTRIENRWQGFQKCNFEQKVCLI